MEEPSVALEEEPDHAHLEELPHEQHESAAEKPAEQGLHEAHGAHGMEDYLLEEVGREVAGQRAVDNGTETAGDYKARHYDLA